MACVGDYAPAFRPRICVLENVSGLGKRARGTPLNAKYQAGRSFVTARYSVHVA